ncbi:Ubiquitin carboxyl-terminal hydrolase 16 [Spathaspora sp. JA1]|nr:Ubiquitin carboxyl-terminal hydrolase 16 [Spathaspora sp. JA1]
MFSKRPDKYTTGLINMRNDCFANSSLQAYSSLPGLTSYLNQFIKSFRKLNLFIHQHNIDIDRLIKLRLEHNKNLQHSKFKSANSKFDIPLHIGMAKLVQVLQGTQMTSRTVSVWTFLHVLENIFNAKISRSQHDAHELVQLINETLENENLKLKSFHRFITKNLHTIVNFPSPQDYSELETIQVPEFPFDGLIMNQMRCLSCQGYSKPNFVPFLILTLSTPQTAHAELEKILDENEKATIEGYQCLKCRISRIVEHEENIKRNIVDSQELKYLNKIVELNNDPDFCINQDLDDGLEDFIRNYSVQGVDVSRITSTVFKKSQILKPPKIFTIHLSRSSFDGQNITRNSCRITFNDHLTLSIGKDYHDRLKLFQQEIRDVDEGPLRGRRTWSVLTTDINDMEDEEVQREDIDLRGTDYIEESGLDTTLDTDVEKPETTDEDSPVDGESGHESSSIPSTEPISRVGTPISFQHSNSTQTSLHNATSAISDKQKDDLRIHFQKFKFNENDTYKYRLRAMIRHFGSHTQGHYECYKHKPLFVKDKEGNIYKLSPQIEDENTGDIICDAAPVMSNEDSQPSDTAGGEPKDTKMRRKFSVVSRLSSNSTDDSGYSSGEEGKRSRFSSLMGRNPSVIQADPVNVEEIIQSGLQTPAELYVDDPAVGAPKPNGQDKSSELFNGYDLKDSFHAKKPKENKLKVKKLSSLINNPFWRISDSRIQEVSTSYVLSEVTTVYMLFYERVDNKQVRRHSHGHQHHHIHVPE